MAALLVMEKKPEFLKGFGRFPAGDNTEAEASGGDFDKTNFGRLNRIVHGSANLKNTLDSFFDIF